MAKRNFRSEKNVGSKKFLRPKKQRQCVIIRILECSVIVDFGGVLAVGLVLLVRWVICTPYPLNSAKSP